MLGRGRAPPLPVKRGSQKVSSASTATEQATGAELDSPTSDPVVCDSHQPVGPDGLQQEGGHCFQSQKRVVSISILQLLYLPGVCCLLFRDAVGAALGSWGADPNLPADAMAPPEVESSSAVGAAQVDGPPSQLPEGQVPGEERRCARH